MKKLIKLIIYWLFPVSFVLMLTFSINILITDFRFAHQSHMVYQHPYSWSKYFIVLPIKKFFINTFNKKNVGLPQVYLFISEKSQEKLLNKTPNSTKQWVGGSLLNTNGNLQKIQIRYRGDNPRNWLFEKKSLRIKTRKRETFEGRRYFEYWPFNLALFVPSSIANRMKILASKSKLVELFINGKSNGVFIENERIDENFLRRNKIMPINLYKGENFNAEALIAIDENLFNNPGLWTKSAIFNQREDVNNLDLKYFLSIVQSAETRDQDFKELLNNINISTWARFSAYTILTQNYHHDYRHNLRLAIDPWTGYVYPIIADPKFRNHFKDKKNSDLIYPLESSNNDLITLLNRSSMFIDAKYKELFEYTVKSTVLSEEIDNLKNLYNDLKISVRRDPEINFNKLLEDIEIYKKDLKEIENLIKQKLHLKPISTWKKNSKNIDIFIEGELPISDIQINYSSQTPKWVVIDENYNGIIDNNEYKFFSNGEKYIFIAAKLYANRVTLSNQKTDMHTRSNIIIGKTKFSIISEKDIKPESIIASNPFSRQKFTLGYNNIDAVVANKFNKVIFSEILKKKKNDLLEFSNQIYVKGNYIIENPVKIYPGTNFLIEEDSHIIFKNKVIAKGTVDNPIIFKKKNNTSKAWGTVALLGQKTSGSEFSHIFMDGGSGGNYNQIYFTSMFSLHNTRNIKIEKIKLINHSDYDDMIHVIYCENVLIDKAELINAFGDAIDIDLSKNITIINSKFTNATNDSIDFMESEALVDSSVMVGSGDKGISIGENSNILIHNSIFKKNNIALAVKDKSIAKVLHTNFENNEIQLSAYSKNWQYGGGGSAFIYRSYFKGKNNFLNSSEKSNLLIDDTSIVGEINIIGKNISSNNVDFYDTKKIINTDDLKLTHPMFSRISLVENINRGYNPLIKEITN